MIYVRNVLRLGVRRPPKEGHAKAVDISRSPAHTVVNNRGCDVVVPSSPIVPRDENRGVGPILTVADGIDNRCYPGGSRAVVAAGMIGFLRRRNYPAHGGEITGLNVGQDLGVLQDDVVRPIG